MPVERPARRMTLRQLLTHSEKCVRDLIEHLNTVLLPRQQDFRDLSRPVRRRSHYPTLLALLNSLQGFVQLSDECQKMMEYLTDELSEIHDHARRERQGRG